MHEFLVQWKGLANAEIDGERVEDLKSVAIHTVEFE